MQKEDCIFCKIANGEIPSKFIYEDEYVVAFNDINPQAPTHILVIPKEHYENLNDLEDEPVAGKLLTAVGKIAKQLNIADYRTITNTGKEAGQEVFHIHLHILAGFPSNTPLL